MKNSRIVTILFVIIILICAVVVGIYLLKNNKEKKLEIVSPKVITDDKYVFTTDMKCKTMQNDGGSYINTYYDIDFNNMVVNKYEDKYKGFEGYIYKGKLLKTINIDKNEVKKIQEIFNKVIEQKDMEKDLLATNYSYYTLITKDYSGIIVNDYSLIDGFLSIVEK